MRPGHHKRLPNYVIGLVMVVLIAVGSYLAYTKKLPWSHGYQVQAVFRTAENIRPKSPVRIAGVDVGEVTSVEPCTSDNPACGGVEGSATTMVATGNPAKPPQDGSTGVQAAIV
jgi:ABC-type transporter Mla subunit MlaD